MTEPQRAVSSSRVLMIVVPIAIIAIAAYLWSKTWESSAQRNGEQRIHADSYLQRGDVRRRDDPSGQGRRSRSRFAR